MNILVLRSSVAALSALSLSACATTGSREELGTVFGAALGGLVASHVANDDREIWIAAGALAGGFLGNRLGRYLDEQDQQRMALATQQAVATGDAQSWTNLENNTSGRVRVIDTEVKSNSVTVPILRERISRVPPLDIIGETYRSMNSSNLRGGPSTDYVIVGNLQPGEIVNVIGQVQGANWYMISQGGVGSGFIYAPLVEAASDAQIDDSGFDAGTDEVMEAQIADHQVCRTVEQSITLADGSTHQSTMEACQGPHGWVAQV